MFNNGCSCGLVRIAICGSCLYPARSPFPGLSNEGGTESPRTLAGCAAGQFESPKHQPVSLRALAGSAVPRKSSLFQTKNTSEPFRTQYLLKKKVRKETSNIIEAVKHCDTSRFYKKCCLQETNDPGPRNNSPLASRR